MTNKLNPRRLVNDFAMDVDGFFSNTFHDWRRRKYEIETRGIQGLYPFSRRCPNCNNLSPYGHFMSEYYLKNDKWIEFPLPEDMKARTKDDCPFCALIVRILDHYFRGSWRPEYYWISMKPEWPIMLHPVSPETSATHGEVECIEVFKDIDTPSWSKTPSIGGGARLFNHSNDQGIYDFITKCLVECGTSHSNCPSSSPVPLPTRLLEISGPNEVSKLVEPMQGERGTYTALSYCWGKEKPLSTIRASHGTHKEGIAWADLPRLFQDAIEITFRLGMRYIWIDSLCIIQDDNNDWEIESENMASIFQNAEITIVAASSTDPKTPILTERVQCAEAAEFDILERDGSHSFLYSRPISSEDMFHFRPQQAKAITRRPWEEVVYKRGWTFQEDLLAKRAIHYLPNRVVWECQMLHLDERQLPRSRNAPGRSLFSSVFNRHKTLRSHISQYRWWDYVEAFTGRDLTYISDKLPAMSGIANIVSQRTDDEYLAGLWRRSLVMHLGWEKDWLRSRSIHPHPSKEYLAPSWSWASLGIKESVKNWEAREVFRVFTSVTDAKVTLKGQNRFGEVKDGFVKLRGPLREIDFFYNPEMSELKTCIQSCQTKEKEYWNLLRLDMALCIGQGLLGTGEVVPTMCRGFPEEQLKDGFPKAHMIILFETWENVIGLVLGRSSRVPGAYERLGRILFKLHDLEGVMQGSVESTITVV